MGWGATFLGLPCPLTWASLPKGAPCHLWKQAAPHSQGSHPKFPTVLYGMQGTQAWPGQASRSV